MMGNVSLLNVEKKKKKTLFTDNKPINTLERTPG